MDCLELCMDQSGLKQWRMRGAVEVTDQVVHELGNLLGAGWHEVGIQGVMVRAADPVLHLPQSVVAGFIGQQG